MHSLGPVFGERLTVNLVIVVIGLVLGSIIGGQSSSILGALFGALLGFCLARLNKLNERLARLETDSKTRHSESISSDSIESTAPQVAGQPDALDPEPWPTEQPAPQTEEAISETPRWTPKPSKAPAPGLASALIKFIRNWLTTGNIPVKVGVIVCFFGVAFLFKYAVDRQLLLLSIELRLIAVAIFGVVLLAFGWRLREKALVYALNLQGGGIGILYLTIFAAMRLYELVPPGLAFTLLVALTAFAGALAVIQNSRALAFFGIVGGFLAPILVSTSAGNHVALFSYYLILNAAVLGIAWFRSWRELNLVGFAFTFVIGGVWGYNNYRPELFATTEPFLILNFIFYQAVAILFSIRQEPDLKGYVDGTLVFGTPVIAFALQARLVSDFEYGLAISALAVAIIYIATAIALFRIQPQKFRLMAESFLALAVAFGTIAIPLALDARWTAVAWALEGTALVWVAVRQQRVLTKYTGSLLLFASGVAFSLYGWQDGIGMPVLNGNYLGGMLIGFASLLAAYLVDKNREPEHPNFVVIGKLLFSWGLIWCIGSGFMEVYDRVEVGYVSGTIAAYMAIAAAIMLAAGEKLDWTLARTTTLLYLPSLAVPFVLFLTGDGHPLADLGWVSWPLAFSILYLILAKQEIRYPQIASIQHAAALIAIAVLGMWEVAWQMNQLKVAGVWGWSLSSVVPGLLVLATLTARKRTYWPVSAFPKGYLMQAGIALIGLQLGSLIVLSLVSGGNPEPIRYIPILNPADISMAFALIVATRHFLTIRDEQDWVTPQQWQIGLSLLGGVAFVLTTAAIMRAVHNFGSVPWTSSALANSVLIQATLSIYWAVLGVSAMALGTKLQRRTVWIAGSSLMAVVVIKLFLVDLGNTGTVERIVSFIGTGVLLLVVGYFAPVPPRNLTTSTEETRTEGA